MSFTYDDVESDGRIHTWFTIRNKAEENYELEWEATVVPFGFDDTKKSLNNGKILANEKGHQSICDSIITPQPGNLTFPINLKTLEDGLVVNDEEVKRSIKILAEHLKIIVEPGGAVAATAALTKKINLNNKTVVVMISGGNIDLDMFRSL